ncbi:MAG: gliding motility-associated C-terminal domain-containing protein [Sphingobacteriales bacterium]|nr:gliding motility-associated C-terminal domain-containing protein [Sphingobacteriales bacterium]
MLKHYTALFFRLLCSIVLLALPCSPLFSQVGANCATPYVIATLPFNELELSNCGMGNDYGTGGCGGSFMGGEDMVFEFTPTQSACYNMQLYAISGNADANILVFDGCPTNNNCIDSGDAGGGGGWGGSSNSFLQIALDAGTTYYVVVGSENAWGGNDCSEFNIYISDPDSAPVNDFCQNATPLGGLGSNYNATACDEPDDWTPDVLFPNGGGWNGTICDGDGGWNANHNGVWYTFNNPSTQDVTIEVFDIVCDGTVGESLLQLGVWSNTGTCDLEEETFYNCLVTVGDAELFLNNLPAGDYYLFCDGSAASLCTWGFASEQVISCNPPQINTLTPTLTQICDGGGAPIKYSIDTIGTQPMSVLWSLNGTPIDSNTLSITVNPTTNAIYTVVASNGCGAATETFEVVASLPPTLTTTVPTSYVLCDNAPTPLTLSVVAGGTPPIAITWAQNSTTLPNTGSSLSITPNATTTYTATAANACGTANQTFNVTMQQAPVAVALSPNNIVLCENTSSEVAFQATATGTIPLSYTWMHNGNTIGTGGDMLFLNAPFSGGTYTATAQNVCGADTVNFLLNLLPLPDAILSGGGAVCNESGDAVPLSIALNGAPPFVLTYTLNGIAQIPIEGITDNPYIMNVTQVGDYALTSVTSSTGCIGTVSGTAVLSEIPLPPAPTLPDTLFYCVGDTLNSITVATSGSVNWYVDNPATNPNAITSSENPLDLNQYLDTQTAQSTTLWANVAVAGCRGPATPILIQVNEVPPPPSATDISLCVGQTLPNLAAEGTQIVWYNAKPGTTNSQIIETGNTLTTIDWLNPQQAGTTVFWFDQTINNCTSLPQSVAVAVLHTPNTPLTTSVSLCANDTILPLTAISDAPITWYDTAAMPIATGDTLWLAETDTVWAVAIDPTTGCASDTAIATLIIALQDTANIQFAQTTYCITDLDPIPQIIGAPNGIFSADNNLPINPQIGNIDLSQAIAGYTYTISYTTQGICPTEAQTQLVVHQINLDITPDTTISEGTTIELWSDANTSAAAITALEWSPSGSLNCANCPAPYATPANTTTYTLTATDAAGCTNAASTTVYIIPTPLIAIVPSAFSPNGDGINDELAVIASDKAMAISLQIYNRWGECVFATNTGEAWNGRYKGMTAEIGVYAYFAQVTFTGGARQNYQGNITLVR